MNWLCIVSCTPELFLDSATRALSTASEPLGLLALGNGTELPLDDLPQDKIKVARVRVLPENRGVVAALHAIWEMSEDVSTPADVLVHIHDDFQLLEQGWDRRVTGVFERDPKCGLAGFGGSTGLASADIYKKPYELGQLGRVGFYSNMVGGQHHGHVVNTEMPIVFTDGQSMILKRELLDKIRGWSWWPFENVHHAYDYGIACMARRHGYTAWLVPVHCNHLNFRTGSQPVYKNLADKYGGDAAVHAKSHRFVYDAFRDVLPLRLP